MDKMSLADVARGLDSMLGGQMTAQARIASHLVAAAEAAGHDAARQIETLDAVAAKTVLDEIWVTDERGVACITNVRDDSGAPMPFEFHPEPALQPQASAFYGLLSAPVGSDAVVIQAAQVREIDNEVYKYVGVGGFDRRRIVQVGNALAFEEQAPRDAYASPVMTAVLAAFGEPELLSRRHTDKFTEIRGVFEAILGRQMVVQATLVDAFAAAAAAAGWSAETIGERLQHIVRTSPTGEIDILGPGGDVICTSGPASSGGGPGPLPDETQPVVEHPVAPRASDGALYKYVTVAGAERGVRVGLPIDDGTLVSPRFRVSAAD